MRVRVVISPPAVNHVFQIIVGACLYWYSRRTKKGWHVSPRSFAQGIDQSWRGRGADRTGRAAFAWMRFVRARFHALLESFFRVRRQTDGHRARGHFHPGESFLRPLFRQLSWRPGIREPEPGVSAAGFSKHGQPADWRPAIISS